MKKEGSFGTDNMATSQNRESMVRLTKCQRGRRGLARVLTGIGTMALFWFLLSPHFALGDPPAETSPTPDSVPAPQKNSSGFDRLIEAYSSVILDTPNSVNA